VSGACERTRIERSGAGRIPARQQRDNNTWSAQMSLGMILLIVLVLILLGVIPTWPHSRQWGYGPSGGIGLVLLIIVILLVLGKI
jgi:hypothetical protein